VNRINLEGFKNLLGFCKYKGDLNMTHPTLSAQLAGCEISESLLCRRINSITGLAFDIVAQSRLVEQNRICPEKPIRST
jgi:hypothetical protein